MIAGNPYDRGTGSYQTPPYYHDPFPYRQRDMVQVRIDYWEWLATILSGPRKFRGPQLTRVRYRNEKEVDPG